MTRLGNITKVLAGQAAPTDFSSEGTPFIRAGHLEELIFDRNINLLPKISHDVAKKEKLKLLPAGSILFAKSGMSATKNRVYITPVASYFVSHLAAILPSENFNTSYLAYYLKWFKPSNLIIDEAYPSIRLSEISDLRIPLPSIAEQKKIAAILDAADSLRQKDQQLVERYNALSQSLFLEMFGDLVTNPMAWECKSLQSLTSKIGSGSTPRGGKEAYFEEGISLIRSLNIHDNEFLMKNLAFIDDKQADELSNVTVEEKDVLLNITGASVCRCAIVPTEILPARVNQHVSILRCDTGLANPYYLLYLIISAQFKQKLMNIAGANGATREALTKSQLSELAILTPPISLQNQFAERIQVIEAQKQQAQRSLEKSEALFNSLLQRAFTGELTSKMAA